MKLGGPKSSFSSHLGGPNMLTFMELSWMKRSMFGLVNLVMSNDGYPNEGEMDPERAEWDR